MGGLAGEVQVEREFNFEGDRLSVFTDQAIDKVYSGLEPDRELMVKVALDMLINQAFAIDWLEMCSDSRKLTRLKIKLVSQFGEEEVREVFDKVRGVKNFDSLWVEMAIWLRSRGIRLPRTEADIDKILEE